MPSLNSVVSEQDEDTELVEFIGTDREHVLGYLGEEYGDPTEIIEQQDLKNYLFNIMETLKVQEREVIIKRCGLEDDHFRTLEEVGNILGVTRERIRQVESKALEKLYNKIKKISEWYDWVS